MRDDRLGLDLCTDVMDVLHRHGFTRGDDMHAGRAAFLIGDLARIYEGTLDYPYVPASRRAPALPPPGPSGQDSRDAVTIPASARKTMLIALDIAAGDMRDRAQMCAGCPGQSCPVCQSRLRDARACDQLAGRIRQAGDATPDADPRPPGTARPARQPGPAAGKEAGQ